MFETWRDAKRSVNRRRFENLTGMARAIERMKALGGLRVRRHCSALISRSHDQPQVR